MFEEIMQMFGSLAPIVGSAFGPIGTVAGTLTGELSAQIVNLIQKHAAGASVSTDYLSALGILQVAITALKATTNLSPTVLAEVNAIDLDLQAAIKGWQTASTGFNPVLYAPIALVS